MTKDELENEVAAIISRGVERGAAHDLIAAEIISFIRHVARQLERNAKPKRGLGMVSQHDLLRGL